MLQCRNPAVLVSVLFQNRVRLVEQIDRLSLAAEATDSAGLGRR